MTPSTLAEKISDNRLSTIWWAGLWLVALSLVGCGGGDSSSNSSTSSSSSSSTSSTSSSSSSSSSSSTSSGCTAGTYTENVVCAANAFMSTLTSTQLASAYYSSSGYTTAQLNVYKTRWSNFPVSLLSAGRAGITLGSLTSSDQTAAFYALADAALTDAGYADFTGVLAADDYLSTLQSGYGSSLAQVAIIGTPSTTDQWTLLYGNHHMAFNITFDNGVAYPTPHHIAVEPKASFTYGGSTYQVLADKAAVTQAIFYGQSDSLSPTTAGSTALTLARLSATYGDVLIGPVEYNTGSYATAAAKFPTSNRGVLVSSLTTAQQALVTAAITKWVSDYDSTVSEDLIAAYTSSTAYASTYVAWSASSSLTYPDVDVANTYMRIDGPRVWIEIACQSGVVVSGTHYHMMFRDKTLDYYDELST